jgi:hypothetical protein
VGANGDGEGLRGDLGEVVDVGDGLEEADLAVPDLAVGASVHVVSLRWNTEGATIA